MLSLHIRRTVVFASIVLLAGCEVFQTRNQSTIEDGSLDTWRARGKFSYQSNESSESGNFDWRQENDAYEIRLYGPFGLGSVRLSGDKYSVQLRNGNQDFSSDQPQQLLYDATGLEIPIVTLAKWMIGRPATKTTRDLTFTPSGNIDSFTENGWRVSYLQYNQIQTNQQKPELLLDVIFLPSEVLIEKDDIEIKLITKSWGF